MKKQVIAVFLAFVILLSDIGMVSCKVAPQTTYTISWLNYDGSVLEIDREVLEGTVPVYDGQTPEKYEQNEDGEHKYRFIGWSPEIEPAYEDKSYVAQFVLTYTAIWYNYDKTVLYMDSKVATGSDPDYCGTKPTRPGDEHVFYVFDSWKKETQENGDVTFTATYTPHYNWEDCFLICNDGYGHKTVVGLSDLGKEQSILYIPDGIEDIKSMAFQDEENIIEIHIPDSVRHIGQYAFYGCTGLRSIVIPDGVSSLSDGQFIGCTMLSHITIPESMIYFDPCAFGECTNLQVICYQGSEEQWNTLIKDTDWNNAEYSFQVIFGNDHNHHYDRWEIYASYGHIGYCECGYAQNEFHSYSGDNDSTCDICGYVRTLAGEGSKGLVFCSYGDGTCYLDNIGNCTDLEIVIPLYSPDGDLVTTIESYAFYGHDELKSVMIPDSVTTIFGEAFFGCKGLQNIIIPIDVWYLDDNTFGECTGLKYIKIGNIKYYEPLAFKACSGIESITTYNDDGDYIVKNNCLIDKKSKKLVLGCKNSVIPDDGSVKEIGDYAFNDCKGLHSLLIPYGVEKIDQFCFSGCSELVDVTLPSTLTTIENSAFEGCQKLSSIELPDSVIAIGSHAFEYCESLIKITIPKGVKCLEPYTFSDCTLLREVILPDGLTSIEEMSLYGCKCLLHITIPESVSYIEDDSFNGCDKLVEICNHSSLHIAEEAGDNGSIVLYDKHIIENECETALIMDDDGFVFYDDGKECWLIDYYGSETDLILPSESPKGGTLKYYRSCLRSAVNVNVTFPYGVTSIPESAFENCSGIVRISIPASVTGIESNAFCGCENMKEVILNEGLERILYEAFKDCRSLKHIEFPSTLMWLEYGAFTGCASLTAVHLPENIDWLRGNPFYACTGLESITVDSRNQTYYSVNNCVIEKQTGALISGCKNSVIPADRGITSIENAAFEGCESLRSITVPEGVVSIGSAFEDCADLSEIYLPESLQTIGVSAFEGCAALSEIYLPESLQTIGVSAFEGCSKLTAVTIPDGVSCLEKYTFEDCVALSEIYLPKSLQTIGAFAFYCCYNLTAVTIPDGVSCLEKYTFARCTNLTTVVIPNTVEVIEQNVFSSCPNLKNVHFQGTESQWNSIEKEADWDEGAGPFSVTFVEEHIHSLYETKAEAAPTCKKKGHTAEIHCSECGKLIQRSEPISKLGHDYGEWYTVTASTENTHGTLRRDCSRCDSFETTEAPLLGHSYTYGYTVAPTCSSYGYDIFVCKDCNDTYRTNFLGFVPHSETIAVISATCTEDGYTKHICTVCGIEYLTDLAPAQGHAFSEWTVEKEATCIQEGIRSRICLNCNVRETSTLQKTPHEYELLYVQKTASGSESTYRCPYCFETKTAASGMEGEIVYDVNELFDVATDFSFYIVCDYGNTYIQNHLIIHDVSYDIEKYPQAALRFTLEKHSKYDNVWRVIPVDFDYTVKDEIRYAKGLTRGCTYVAELSGTLSFLDYNTDALYFSTERSNVNKAKLSDYVHFLRVMEDKNPGYYPYTVINAETSDYIYVILEKCDEMAVGDILVIGEVRSIEEIQTIADLDENRSYIGKIAAIEQNDDEQYIITLSEPDITEVFDELDISLEEAVQLQDDEVFKGEIAQYLTAQLIQSEDFSKFLTAVDETNLSYATGLNLKASSIKTKKFSDIVHFDKPYIIFTGSGFKCKLTGHIGGENGIELKTKSDTVIGSIEITFTVEVEISFEMSAECHLKWGLIIPTGIKSIDVHLKETDVFSFNFSVDFKIDYDLESEEKNGHQYWYNLNSGVIHYSECEHIIEHADLQQEHWIIIDEARMKELCSKGTGRECVKCKPYTRLLSMQFVYNSGIDAATGKPINTIHSLSCYYVSLINETNKDYRTGNFTEVVKAVEGDYGISEIHYCEWCKPNIDMYSKAIIEKLKYADWGRELEDTKQWMKESGSDACRNEGVNLGKKSFILYGIEIDLEVILELSFDLKAPLDIDYKQANEHIYGIRYTGGNFKTYTSSTVLQHEMSAKLVGSVSFTSGIRFNAKVSIIGLQKWLYFGFYGTAGVYADANGILYWSSDENDKLYAGAKFVFGFYFDIGVTYKALKWKDDKSIIKKKYPLITLGYDKVYYSFNNELELLKISGSCSVQPDDILNVKYYDITKEQTGKEVLSLDNNTYSVSGHMKDGRYCSFENGKIVVKNTAPCYFEDVLVIEILGNTKWNAYVSGSSVFCLDALEIPIVYINENHPHVSGYSYREDGDRHWLVCAGCGYSYRSEPHHMNSGSVSSAPTHTTYGVINYTCIECGATVMEQIEKLTAHEFGPWIAVDAYQHQRTCACGVAEWSAHVFDGENDMICNVCEYKRNEILPSKGLLFTSNGDGTCRVSGIGTCTDENIVIPSQSPDGDVVIEIGANAFEFNFNIREVTIPDTVTRIGEYAFYDSDLTTVHLPADLKVIEKYAFGRSRLVSFTANTGLEIIGAGAFEYCTKLTNVLMPDTVKKIEDHVFYECNSLTSVTIPDSIEYIGAYAFAYCEYLTDLKIPNNLTSVGQNAFLSCRLGNLVIPENVTSISPGAFAGTYLSEISVNKNNQYYYSVNNCVIEKKTKKLILGCKNSIIPSDGSVTSIGDYAFMFTWDLTEFYIPDCITEIGYSAFDRCTNLTHITLSANLKTIASYAFYYSGLETIIIPDGVTCLEHCSFADCESLISIVIPDSVTTIEDNALHCPNLKFIQYTGTESQWDKVTKGINWNSNTANYTMIFSNVHTHFYGSWISMDDVYHRHVCSCGNDEKEKHVFTNDIDTTCDICGYVRTSTPSNGLSYQSNGDGTCSVSGIGTCKDTAIVIPEISPNGDRVTKISRAAFQNQTGISNVILPYTLTAIGDFAFDTCSSLKSIVIPGNVTYIGYRAFDQCSALQEITLNEGLQHIEGYAFTDCDHLTSITIPESVTDIGEALFYDCSILQFVQLPQKVDNINTEKMFGLCGHLVLIGLPYGVSSIGESAFIWCEDLSTVTIPNQITRIDSAAFYGCRHLLSIYYNGTVEEWNNVSKESEWKYGANSFTVFCTDGEVSY